MTLTVRFSVSQAEVVRHALVLLRDNYADRYDDRVSLDAAARLVSQARKVVWQEDAQTVFEVDAACLRVFADAVGELVDHYAYDQRSGADCGVVACFDARALDPGVRCKHVARELRVARSAVSRIEGVAALTTC